MPFQPISVTASHCIPREHPNTFEIIRKTYAMSSGRRKQVREVLPIEREGRRPKLEWDFHIENYPLQRTIKLLRNPSDYHMGALRLSLRQQKGNLMFTDPAGIVISP